MKKPSAPLNGRGNPSGTNTRNYRLFLPRPQILRAPAVANSISRSSKNKPSIEIIVSLPVHLATLFNKQQNQTNLAWPPCPAVWFECLGHMLFVRNAIALIDLAASDILNVSAESVETSYVPTKATESCLAPRDARLHPRGLFHSGNSVRRYRSPITDYTFGGRAEISNRARHIGRKSRNWVSSNSEGSSRSWCS